MGKRLFWIFLLSVAAISGIAVAYIQSESFARIVRRELQERVAKSLGVELNFERVKIGVLPPSLALQGVDLKVSSAQNQLGLATDTIFKAASLGFSFRMIQAFSRGITVNCVAPGFIDTDMTRAITDKAHADWAAHRGLTKFERLREFDHAGVQEGHAPVVRREPAENRRVEHEHAMHALVRGKRRGEITIARDANNATVEKAALALEQVQAILSGQPPMKVVIVPQRIINVVA